MLNLLNFVTYFVYFFWDVCFEFDFVCVCFNGDFESRVP